MKTLCIFLLLLLAGLSPASTGAQALQKPSAALSNPHTLSIEKDTVPICASLPTLALGIYNAGQKQQAYDTSRYYIEHCFMEDGSAGEFDNTSNYNQNRSDNHARYSEYREWLKSVLYLNSPDPNWYCSCANAFLHSLNWIPGRAPSYTDYNAGLALLTFLIQENHCPGWLHDWQYDSAAMVLDRAIAYHDTLPADPKAHPMDTTLPSLEDLGLGILRGKPNGVVVNGATGTPRLAIGDLHASQNPFRKETEVWFEMESSVYLTIQVFDQLGMVRQGDGRGTVYSPGRHSFTVDGTHLAPGTYYARIASPTGDVRTVKLVKE